MENSEAFDADARIEIVRSRDSATIGHDTAVATGALIDGSPTERSPLLSRDERADYSPRAGSPSQDELPPWSPPKEYEGLPWYRRPSPNWLIPALLFHTLAFGGIIVPKLNIILKILCRNYLSDKAARIPGFTFAPVLLDGDDNPQCRDAEVQALASRFTLYMQFLAGFFSALVAPTLGSLSDRYGRVPILLITNLGVIAGEATTIFAAKYYETVSINWILVGAVLDGLCGTFVTSMAISNAYAVDCTPPTRRAVIFARFHGCLFGGLALGPLAAGLIFRATGSLLSVFYTALGAHSFFILYIMFVVPESLTKEMKLRARERHAAGIAEAAAANEAAGLTGPTSFASYPAAALRRVRSFFSSFAILWPTGPGTFPALRRNLALLSAIDFIIFGVAMGSSTVLMYYVGFRFEWDTAETSFFLSAVSFSRVTALLALLPLVTRLVRGRRKDSAPNTGADALDIGVIWFSITMDMLGAFGFVSAQTGAVMVLAGCVASLGGMASPTVQSTMTKHVPQEQVGKLLGAVGLLHSLARVFAPVLFNFVYAKTVDYNPQIVFMMLGGWFALAGLLSLFLRPHIYFNDTVRDRVEPTEESTAPEIRSEN